MKVLRKPQYWESLQAIEDYIAHDKPRCRHRYVAQH